MTSVGETIPAAVTSMPPTAKVASSSTSAATAAAAARVGEQGGQRGRGERRRLEQRFGQTGAARLLEHADQVDVAQAEPARRFGHHERGCPELGQHGPAVAGQLGAPGPFGQVEGA